MSAPISRPAATRLDAIDRALLTLLAADGRATYHDLARQVRLSANATADRIRRLRRDGLLRGYTADIDLRRLGMTLYALTSIRLREGVDRRRFERDLATLPQVLYAAHTTGPYDYELRIGCGSPEELEAVVDRLKDRCGVREANSRVVLGEVELDPLRVLNPDST